MWQRFGATKEKGQLQVACSQHQMPGWTFLSIVRGHTDLRSDLLNVRELKKERISVVNAKVCVTVGATL